MEPKEIENSAAPKINLPEKEKVSQLSDVLGVFPTPIIDSLATRIGALAVISTVLKEVSASGISGFALYFLGVILLLLIYPGIFLMMDIAFNENKKDTPAWKKFGLNIAFVGAICVGIAAPVIYLPSFSKIADLVVSPLGSIIFVGIIFVMVIVAFYWHNRKQFGQIFASLLSFFS